MSCSEPRASDLQTGRFNAVLYEWICMVCQTRAVQHEDPRGKVETCPNCGHWCLVEEG